MMSMKQEQIKWLGQKGAISLANVAADQKVRVGLWCFSIGSCTTALMKHFWGHYVHLLLQ